MNSREFRDRVIEPGAAWTEAYCGVPSSPAARRLLLAIAAQESDLKHRFQKSPGAAGGVGPARSFWQAELTGGMITGVMGLYQPSKPSPFPAVTQAARVLCEAASVEWDRAAIWRAIEGNDLLAYGLARLLLRTDPAPIPEGQQAAWATYANTWRPGAPKPARWPSSWQQATAEYP